MNNNFKKFKKIPLIISIAFFLGSSALFYFLYSQTQSNYKVSEKLEIDLQNEKNKRGEIKILDQSLKMIEAERVLLDSHFIKSSDVVPFLDMIEEMAPKALASAQVSLVDLAKDNSSLIVEMKVTGKFEAIYKFLTLLENSPYELSFASVSMQKQGEEISADENSVIMWSATFRVNLLSFIK